MKLTTGQKKALVNRVMEIINDKRAAKEKELIEGYKPSKEDTAFLAKIKAVLDARDAYHDAAKKAGLVFSYSSVNTPYGSELPPISISHDYRTPQDYDNICDIVRKAALSEKYTDTYPTVDKVEDDIELLSLGSDFDVEAFLDKYRNL